MLLDMNTEQFSVEINRIKLGYDSSSFTVYN